MSNHPRTGAPAEPPRRRTNPNPPHDPNQDAARALQDQTQQGQQIKTGLGGDPAAYQPDDPATP